MVLGCASRSSSAAVGAMRKIFMPLDAVYMNQEFTLSFLKSADRDRVARLSRKDHN